jgi:hypothetical protein
MGPTSRDIGSTSRDIGSTSRDIGSTSRDIGLSGAPWTVGQRHHLYTTNPSAVVHAAVEVRIRSDEVCGASHLAMALLAAACCFSKAVLFGVGPPAGTTVAESSIFGAADGSKVYPCWTTHRLPALLSAYGPSCEEGIAVSGYRWTLEADATVSTDTEAIR